MQVCSRTSDQHSVNVSPYRTPELMILPTWHCLRFKFEILVRFGIDRHSLLRISDSVLISNQNQVSARVLPKFIAVPTLNTPRSRQSRLDDKPSPKGSDLPPNFKASRDISRCPLHFHSQQQERQSLHRIIFTTRTEY